MSNRKLVLFFLILFELCQISKCMYSVPDLSETSNKITTYTIDFKGIDTPEATYWSLANYHLDTSDFEKTHSEVTGGGAYGGLQTLYNGERVAIMSFWKINYKENGQTQTLKFSREYPPGEEMNFSGEGEGTTYRAPYDWKSNVWYRFVLHTWKDTRTGKTLIGQWIQDLSTKEWTLFAYFNTNLTNSYIGGGYGALGLFQEIFSDVHKKKDRSFQFKNMYIFDKERKQWASINKSYLYFGETPGLTKGLGYTPLYFFGYTMPSDEGQNKDAPNGFTGSITQPSTPDFDKPAFKKFNINITSKRIELDWEMDSKACPAYEYTFMVEELQDSKYIIKTQFTITRPEQTSFSANFMGLEGTVRVTLKAYALSNEFVTKQVEKIL